MIMSIGVLWGILWEYGVPQLNVEWLRWAVVPDYCGKKFEHPEGA